jgi:hypothetical protein
MGVSAVVASSNGTGEELPYTDDDEPKTKRGMRRARTNSSMACVPITFVCM